MFTARNYTSNTTLSAQLDTVQAEVLVATSTVPLVPVHTHTHTHTHTHSLNCKPTTPLLRRSGFAPLCAY